MAEEGPRDYLGLALAIMSTKRPSTGSPPGSAPAPKESRRAVQETIAQRARELWQRYGCPAGRDEEIWLEAERQVLGSTPAPPANDPAKDERRSG